jgi:hypothetical protein
MSRARMLKDCVFSSSEDYPPVRTSKYVKGTEGKITGGPFVNGGKGYVGVSFSDGEAWYCIVGEEVEIVP